MVGKAQLLGILVQYILCYELLLEVRVVNGMVPFVVFPVSEVSLRLKIVLYGAYILII